MPHVHGIYPFMTDCRFITGTRQVFGDTND